jgi:hypothetical protein
MAAGSSPLDDLPNSQIVRRRREDDHLTVDSYPKLGEAPLAYFG